MNIHNPNYAKEYCKERDCQYATRNSLASDEGLDTSLPAPAEIGLLGQVHIVKLSSISRVAVFVLFMLLNAIFARSKFWCMRLEYRCGSAVAILATGAAKAVVASIKIVLIAIFVCKLCE